MWCHIVISCINVVVKEEPEIYQPWRTGLLLLLFGCMNARFIIEQPGSSLFFHYKYVKEAMKKLMMAGIKAMTCSHIDGETFDCFNPLGQETKT